ncbi:hypothetical protein V1478_017234 [Vespula squamosa]|uniref:Uncharacterized protein n=1 Tax=Vespula squamosa TaxID=30214 RepID=A0ABD1ZXE6_VESSQ
MHVCQSGEIRITHGISNASNDWERVERGRGTYKVSNIQEKFAITVEAYQNALPLNRSFKRVNLAARDREHEKVRALPLAIANGDDDDDDYDDDSRAGDRNSLIADNLMILPDII